MMILNKTFLDSFSAKLNDSARIIIIFSLICLPFSHAWVEKSFIMALLCGLIGNQWQQKWYLIRHNPVASLSLLLVGLFIVGVLYSHAPMLAALQELAKYMKVLMVILTLYLFKDFLWRKLALNVFICAVVLSVLLSYINAFHFFDLSPYFGLPADNSFFIDTISYSVLIALTAYFTLYEATISQQAYKWLYLIAFLLMVYYLFFINIERTGYVIFFALFILFVWQKFRLKGLLFICLLAPIIAIILYVSSSNFKDRVTLAATNIISYKHGQQRTSIGYRLAFAKDSLKSIKVHPIFGTGTGSFRTVYAQIKGIIIFAGKGLGDPHNEYILVTFQLGLIGLIVFLLWIGYAWCDARKLPVYERNLTQAIVLTFFINGFCNVSLTVNTTGYLYVILVGIMLAAQYDDQRQPLGNK